jgi:hypothetical protein
VTSGSKYNRNNIVVSRGGSADAMIAALARLSGAPADAANRFDSESRAASG